MDTKFNDKKIYDLARSFLLENTPDEIDNEALNLYFSISPPKPENFSLKDLYFRLLDSAQNANMKAKVIGGSIEGFTNLNKVLFDFDPDKVLQHYLNNPEKLLSNIITILKPKGKIRQTPRSIWPQYCKTILSAAEFINQFNNSKEFFEWADFFYKDKKSLTALPLIIESEVFGLAFPLACDFLKELGYIKFGKPDVHIIEIFESTSLIQNKSSNYQVLKAIIRVADNNNISAYKVDKLFWLIGSCYFYKHKQVGEKGRLPSLKKAFIQHVGQTET